MDSNKLLAKFRLGIGALINLFFPGLGQLIAGFFISGFLWLAVWVIGWFVVASILHASTREAIQLILGAVGDKEFVPFILVFKGASVVDLVWRFYRKNKSTQAITEPKSLPTPIALPMTESAITDSRLESRVIRFLDKAAWILPAGFIMARLVIGFFGGGFGGEVLQFGLAAIALQAIGFVTGWQAAKLKTYQAKLSLMIIALLFTTAPFMYYLYFVYSFSKTSW